MIWLLISAVSEFFDVEFLWKLFQKLAEFLLEMKILEIVEMNASLKLRSWLRVSECEQESIKMNMFLLRFILQFRAKMFARWFRVKNSRYVRRKSLEFSSSSVVVSLLQPDITPRIWENTPKSKFWSNAPFNNYFDILEKPPSISFCFSLTYSAKKSCSESTSGILCVFFFFISVPFNDTM